MIAIPSLGLAEEVVKIGNCSGSNTDKFKRFGLTPLAVREVRPPLIKECSCNLECRVEDGINATDLRVRSDDEAKTCPIR